MPRQIVLLRGVNLGARNRISMPELRDALETAGFDDVRTYLQSGNVVVSSRTSADRVTRTVERLIADRFGLEIEVVVRTRAQLAGVVRRNPLAELAVDPKRYQVSFLAAKLAPEVVPWHPKGVARSKLWSLLAGRGLGVTATARNWTTVTKLLEFAGD